GPHVVRHIQGMLPLPAVYLFMQEDVDAVLVYLGQRYVSYLAGRLSGGGVSPGRKDKRLHYQDYEQERKPCPQQQPAPRPKRACRLLGRLLKTLEGGKARDTRKRGSVY